MARSDRSLSQLRGIPWQEFRRRATAVFALLQAGWNTLSHAEREEVRRLVMQSRGRPKNLSREDARRLGRIAARAARAAAAQRRR